jgi:signal transduction histidine kinase
MRIPTTFLILLNLSILVQAESYFDSKQCDSLRTAFQLPSDQDKAYIILDDTFYYFLENNFNESKKIFPLLYRCGYELNNPFLKASFYKTCSYYHDFLNQQDSAIFYIRSGLDILDTLPEKDLKHYDLQAKLYNALAMIYQEAELYEPSIKTHLESIAIAENLNKKEQNNTSVSKFLAWAYNDLATTYSYTKDTNKTYYYFEKAKNFSKYNASEYVHAIIELNYGVFLLNQRKTDSALHIFLDAKKHLDVKNSATELSILQLNLSKVYIEKKDFEKAQQILLPTIDELARMGFPYYLAQAYIIQTDLYYNWGKMDQALQSNTQLQDLITASNSIYLKKQCLLSFAQIYEKLNKPKKAIDYLNQYVQLSDSLQDAETDERINNLDVFYTLKETQFKNKELEETNSMQEMELELNKRKTLLYLGAVLLLLISSLFIILIGRNNRKRLQESSQKAKKLQEATKELTELVHTNNQLFGVLSHDLRGPISTLKSIIDMVNTMDLPEEERKKLYHSMRISINSTYELMDNMLYWARARMQQTKFENKTIYLHQAVAQVIESVEGTLFTKDIQFINEIDPELNLYTCKDLIHIVIRNILTNAVKFTPRYGTIRIDTVMQNKQIILRISDTGRGMSQEIIEKIKTKKNIKPGQGTELETGSGFGLMVTAELLQKLNAELNFISELNQGTTVEISFPMSQVDKQAGTRD